MNTSTISYVHTNHGSNGNTEDIINLDHGDPTMYYTYWRDQDSSWTFSGHQHLSYFSSKTNLCWFMEPKLEEEIKNIHNLVGNAVVKDRHIVIGIGSSQLLQAAWYALADQMNEPNPVTIVSEAPYYSCYEDIVEFLQSRLFKWGGDANNFNSRDAPYIEMVTSPNNPDGAIRGPTVKIEVSNDGANKGKLVHDLAYYWPQFTAITSPADHDIMLFTSSKSTGHAGSRIGWAIVRDKEVAKKMVKFMEISTIGVSKEAQVRVASLLHTISSSCGNDKPGRVNFFLHSKRVMAKRWKRLRDYLDKNTLLSLPEYPIEYCNFTGEFTEPRPAYAWIKCKEGVDCEELFMEQMKMKTRGGKRFGSGKEYARINMMAGDAEFDRFMERLPNINYAWIDIQS